MAYQKSEAEQKGIIAQSAGNAAAVIYAAVAPGGWDPDLYNEIRKVVFNGTLALAGAESVVELFEASPAASGGGVGGTPTSTSNGAGSYVIPFGGYKGRTIEQVYNSGEEGRKYVVEFLAEKSNHNNTRQAAQKYVAQVAA